MGLEWKKTLEPSERKYMSFLKRFSNAIDSDVVRFTKFLQSERGPLISAIAPSGSVQAMMYGLGISSLGNAASPEATLASVLKEWNKLQTWSLQTQTSVIESRVLGNKFVSPDSITTFTDWLMWRMLLEFPSHDMSARSGWSREFYEFAILRSKDFF